MANKRSIDSVTIIDLLKTCDKSDGTSKDDADTFMWLLRNALNNDVYTSQIANKLGCYHIGHYFEQKNNAESLCDEVFIVETICPNAPTKKKQETECCRPTPPNTPI